MTITFEKFSVNALFIVVLILILFVSVCLVCKGFLVIRKKKQQQTLLDLYEKITVLQPDVTNQPMHSKNIKEGTFQDRLILTKAFTRIYETIRDEKVTIISGPPGCGKTFVSHQAALKLNDTNNYIIVVVSNPLTLISSSLNIKKKQVYVIDDCVGKYSLDKNSLQAWRTEKNVISHFLDQGLDAKLIVTCRSYIYRNEQFSLLKLPHTHCDMLEDSMYLSLDERRLIANCFVSEEELKLLNDDIIMLYNFFPLICKQYRDQDEPKIANYFQYPIDIVENEMNELRLSSDPCFVALGLLVVCNNFIDKRSLMLNDHKETTGVRINDVLNDLLQNVEKNESFISFKGISSILSQLENTYVKENGGTLICINESMFDMLVGVIGRHIIPCILKHSSSKFIKDYMALSQFTTGREPNIIKIEIQYETLYFNRIRHDIDNGFNWDVFDTFQMKCKEYRSYFLENVLKTEKPTFCKCKKDGSTPLHITALLGYDDLSFFFVESDKAQIYSTDNTGKTPLHMACLKGNAAVAKLLIIYNAEINQMTANEETPFMFACSSGNINLIKFLLNKGVDINLCSSLGSSPLLEVCRRNNVKASSLLLENKAKVDCFNKNGDTPIHLACQAGQTEILNMLLKYDIGTCINRSNVKGYTPFYLAISNGHNEIANTIIKYGADPNYHNGNGSTPLHIACETNN